MFIYRGRGTVQISRPYSYANKSNQGFYTDRLHKTLIWKNLPFNLKLGAIFILRKGVLGLFQTTHLPCKE